MIQILFSEWIVRLFLLYLLVVGSLTLFRRQKPELISPFVFFALPGIGDRWAGRWKWCAAPPAKWWNAYGMRIDRPEPSDYRIWRNGDGLRYA